MKGYAHLGFLAAMLLGMLAGCSSRDPYARDDVWYPSGAPAANLAAQLANPADLAGGRDDPRQHSAASIKAVDRIWADSPKALVVAPTGVGGGGGGGGGSQAGGG
jgi:type IV pilus biogenesis protein CpaD/CtpE